MPDVVDIGFTWLAGSAQRTPVNTEAKLLMMTHAFEVWRVHRVALQTDVRNKRSWAAIERIGGQLDGIMRADRPGSDDTVRTSARFSIVASEWPDVKARLTALELGPASRRPGRVVRRTQARASVAEILRRCSACTAASASSLGRTAATALPVRWILQASWSARSTVWPKISTKASDHRLERRHVVVPDDHRPQVLELEEGVDVLVGDVGEVDGRGVVER